MTPERQRIAIAEACGWTFKEKDGQLFSYNPTSKIGRFPHTWELPDYLNDLNAMFSAFATLGRHWEISQVHDGYYCRIEYGPKRRDVIAAGLELAPVMAEAFLKTLNKWEES